MLDIKAIRNDPQAFQDALAQRDPAYPSIIKELLHIDETRRAQETKRQQLQSQRKTISKQIGALKSKGEDSSEVENQVRQLKQELDQIAQEAERADDRQRQILLEIPNIPHAACPVGVDEHANPEIRTWGDKPSFSFQPKGHLELLKTHQLVDFERAAKISGSGFATFTGQGARLQRALIQYLLDIHTQEHGYHEHNVPHLVNRQTMTGTGQLPKFEDDAYGIREEDGSQNHFLIPTAEVPLTNLWADELLSQDQLPIAATAHTPCFRREAGSAGKETRGLLRMHQFDKVELIHIVEPEHSMSTLETLTQHAETILQNLQIPYRVIELCTGDLGFSATKTYDIEVWAPGQDSWLEVSSCSNTADYQARRMNLRYKNQDGKNTFPHTLNGSGTALPRLIVALLENNQQADGSISIPAVLHPYLPFTQIS